VRQRPGPPREHAQLGHILLALGAEREALECFRRAVRRDPNDAWSLISLGSSLMYAGEHAEAILWIERALALEPENPDAHLTLAYLLLTGGELERGWREMEARWRSPGMAPLLGVSERTLVPAWEGAELAGKAIVLHAEQGLGDTLQFVRYVPLVAARGGRVILGCQPELKRLLSGMPGVDEIRAAGERLYSPEPPWHAALMSLPRIFGTTLETIPPSSYLRADEALAASWAARLASERRFRVGLVWAGGPFNPRNRGRSLELRALAPLGRLGGVAFYSFQTGAAARQAAHAPAGLELTELPAALTDFAETAAALQHMDLLITVDTAVAHLAGALGRPVWILLPYAPDWRWLLAREDSPWYPSARLFRQPRPGDWRSVIARVADALEAQLATS
jgi:hypothetical protein